MKQTPYLIQRATFHNMDGRNGIDSILNFHYMGSAEFEFGALPKSLKRIRNNINSYTYLDVPIKDKVITVFCSEENKSEIRDYLTNLSVDKYSLKEFSAFRDYITGEGYFTNRVDFWWDIDNDIMFWRKYPDFEVKFKKLIDNKKDDN